MDRQADNPGGHFCLLKLLRLHCYMNRRIHRVLRLCCAHRCYSHTYILHEYEVACNYNVVCYTSAKMDEAANEWKGVCYELLYD